MIDLLHDISRNVYRTGKLKEISKMDALWNFIDLKEEERKTWERLERKHSPKRLTPKQVAEAFPRGDLKRWHRRSERITQAMIEQANDYPIESLMQTWGFKERKKRYQCPLHGGEDYNFGVKYNRYNCFVCNEKGGPINLVMEIENKKFKDAVKWLLNQ